MNLTLAAIEGLAAERGMKLRLLTRRWLGAWSLRVVVARPRGETAELLGDLKGWAVPLPTGLHLDTMRVAGQASQGVGTLIWAATFAWALEETPCRRARLLAIRDDARQHRRLVRYFSALGFTPLRELGSQPVDLGLRLVWGGSGLLMGVDCSEGLRRCERKLQYWPPQSN